MIPETPLRFPSEKFASQDRGAWAYIRDQNLGGTTCLTLLVYYGLV